MKMKKISNNIFQLSEATFEIDSDIDFIINKYKDLRSDILSKKYQKIINKILYTNDSTTVYELSSSEFNSEILQEAHKKNPIKIKIGILEKNPSYSPSNKEVILGYDKRILHQLVRADFDFRITMEFLKIEHNTSLDLGTQVILLRNFFSEMEMISQTVHELSHWLRDTFSNGKLFSDMGKKDVKKQKEILDLEKDIEKEISNKERIEKKNKIDKLRKEIQANLAKGKSHISLSSYEIDAQIHELVFLHKKTKEEVWDKFSFENLFEYLSHLKVVESLIKKDKSLYKEWKHLLFVRLLREGILPKNLRDGYRERVEDRIEKHQYADFLIRKGKCFTTEHYNPYSNIIENMLFLSEINEAKKENRNAE